MVDLQRKTLHGIVAAFNAHDARALAAFYTSDATVRSPSRDGTKEEKGREPLEKGHAALFQSMPDVKVGTRRAWSQGDAVVWEWTATGTEPAPKGGPPKRVGFTAASVLWFDAEGLVKVDHTYFDLATLAAEVGPSKKGERPPIPVTLPAEGSESWAEATGSDAESAATAQLTKMYALFEKGNEAGLFATLDDKGLFPHPTTRRGVGKEEFKQLFRAYKQASPGTKVSVDTTFAFERTVAAEITITHIVDGTSRVEHRLEIGPFNTKMLGITSYGNTPAALGK